VRLYKLAVDQGNAYAQYHLGKMYENGRGGLPKDDREAARLYELAADQGAVGLYKLAADQGHASAQYYLGVMYENGHGGLPKDDREAVRLYKLAADQGYASAQNILKQRRSDLFMWALLSVHGVPAAIAAVGVAAVTEITSVEAFIPLAAAVVAALFPAIPLLTGDKGATVDETLGLTAGVFALDILAAFAAAVVDAATGIPAIVACAPLSAVPWLIFWALR
jgi:hypothetical protein